MKSLIVVLTLLSLLVAPSVAAASPNRTCLDSTERAMYLLVLRTRTPNHAPALRLDQALTVQAVQETRNPSGAMGTMVTTGTADPRVAMAQFWADPQNAVRLTDAGYTGVGIALRMHGTLAHPRYTWAIVLGQYTGAATYC